MSNNRKQDRRENAQDRYERERQAERFKEWRETSLSLDQMLSLAQRVDDWHYADRRTCSSPYTGLTFLYENENLLTGHVGHLTLKFTKHPWYASSRYTILFLDSDNREIDTMYDYLQDYKKQIRALYIKAKSQAEEWVLTKKREWDDNWAQEQKHAVAKARSLLLEQKLDDPEE